MHLIRMDKPADVFDPVTGLAELVGVSVACSASTTCSFGFLGCVTTAM